MGKIPQSRVERPVGSGRGRRAGRYAVNEPWIPLLSALQLAVLAVAPIMISGPALAQDAES
jgi:hypothetical protein